MLFYNHKEAFDKSISYMFIEEGIIIGIYAENLPLMKTKKHYYLRSKIIIAKIVKWGLAKNIPKMVEIFKS